MGEKKRPTGAQIRKRRKAKRKLAEEERIRQEHQTADPARSAMRTPEDIQVFRELEQHPEWSIPQEVFERAPTNLLKMSESEEHKPTTRISAVNALTRMVGQNQDARRQKATLSFSMSRHYDGRHSHAQTPEADDTQETDDDSVDAVKVAYREKVSLDEAEEAARELDTLNLLPLLLGMDPSQ